MTVFLKGCPLRCMWCHSPEGQSFAPEIIRSPNGCLSCGNCGKFAENGNFTEKSISSCPQNLLRVCGESLSPQELIDRLSPKLSMLNSAGGGITFSGGEPLSQSEFLYESLKALKSKTNRALQTSGFADAEVFSKILTECDFVLFDLKLFDRQKHIEYTGQSNKSILENYKILAKSKIPFITRIPLIPTVNDTIENIEATAKFMQENGVNRVELLPYNTSAGAKYAAAGKKYSPLFPENIKPELHEDIFKNYGIEVSVL